MKANLLACLIASVVMVSCIDEGTRQEESTAASESAARAAPLPRLHAETGSRAGIYDEFDREVLLRGVNYTSLGDYYQGHPDLPPAVKPRPNDLPNMASLGFNVIRLVIHWSQLEPIRGELNQAYISEIREQVRAAEAQGMYVVLDMHQDAWGKHIATPAGEFCLPPLLQPAIGWDGAPDWATITDGLSTCRISIRELSPAVTAAFTNFWLDRNGIQSALVTTWGKLAAEFAAEPAVAGYDLLNEPHPGFLLGVSELLSTGSFYGRAIKAIRAAEAKATNGFSHIVFFEPTVDWSAFGATLPPLKGFTSDTNIVFAPHLYADSITIAPLSIEQGFQLAKLAADSLGTALWSGEWGWFGDPVENDAKLREYASFEDKYRIGGAWWVWRQACGDPHSLNESNGEIPGDQIALWRNGCPGDIDMGLVPEYALTLSRAYPRATPGRLLTLSADIDTGAIELTGATAKPGVLELWLPERIGAPEISGGEQVELKKMAGGFLLSLRVQDDYRVSVTPSR